MLADGDVRRRLKLLSTAIRKRCYVTSVNPVGEIDLHLFNEGTHRHLHNILGAHPDATGTWFAVWAPNAAAIDVLGDFDGWTGQRLEPIGTSGIWSGHVPEALTSGSPTATP